MILNILICLAILIAVGGPVLVMWIVNKYEPETAPDIAGFGFVFGVLGTIAAIVFLCCSYHYCFFEISTYKYEVLQSYTKEPSTKIMFAEFYRDGVITHREATYIEEEYNDIMAKRRKDEAVHNILVGDADTGENNE